MNKLVWKKSSYSGASGGNCIEVAGHGSRVLIRDTQDRKGSMLTVSPSAWQRFVERLRNASLVYDSRA
jgi:Domain of unknown function (DUF397)